METKRFNIDHINGEETILEAAQLLRKGEVVAFPTETVYGLGADATNDSAVQKIFQAKGRPSDNPLIVHVAEKDQLKAITASYPAYVERLMAAFSPGPITYVLPGNHSLAKGVSAGLHTVGIRIPDHPVALALLRACRLPIAAPSANLSGKPSPTNADHVMEDLHGKIAAIVDGGDTQVGLESTVVDCTGDFPIILRHGKVTKQALESIVDKVIVSDSAPKGTPKSPGVKYKHYEPEVPLIVVNENRDLQPVIQSEKQKGQRVGVLISSQTAKNIEADKKYIYGENEHELAANLYRFLRMMKKDDVDIVIAQSVPNNSVGTAIMDRLKKAAEKVI